MDQVTVLSGILGASLVELNRKGFRVKSGTALNEECESSGRVVGVLSVSRVQNAQDAHPDCFASIEDHKEGPTTRFVCCFLLLFFCI